MVPLGMHRNHHWVLWEMKVELIITKEINTAQSLVMEFRTDYPEIWYLGILNILN